MKFFVFIPLLFFSLSYFGQTELHIIGKVTDSATNLPIENCFVSIDGTLCAGNTDVRGRYDINCPILTDSIKITCNISNYKSATIIKIRNSKKKSSEKIQVDFKLTFESYMLPEMNVSGAPQTVWSSDQLNVADFAFVGKNLLLLTYEKEERWKKQEESKITLLQGCQLILLDENNKEVLRTSVPEVSINFYVNYLNEVFLRCRQSIFHIRLNDDKIVLEKIPEEDFRKGIQPIIDTCGPLTCFSNYNADYPAFEYMIFNAIDSSYKTFRYMIDEKMMEMFRSEYKYLDTRGKLEAFTFEVNTGIDKEIIAAYMNGFQNTPYYEPLNTPLIRCNDTLIIFDHHHDKMIQFDWNGQALDSVLIQYHKTLRPERWDEKILKDRKTQKIYTSFRKQGITYIREINKQNGEVSAGQKLSYKYVENVRVSDDSVYYVYRPFESSQNRFLYKELIAR